MHQNYRDKIKNQLGISGGAASNKLRNMLMFDLASQLGLTICFQCGEAILSWETMSIDHKEPWLDKDNAKSLYFDLGNVTFSHRSCNSAAARREKALCPSYTAYKNHGCRCDECKKIASDYLKKYRQRPEVKEKRRQYEKSRQVSNERKEYIRKYQRDWYHKNK